MGNNSQKKKERSSFATKRRDALMYARSLVIKQEHEPYTLSKKELCQTLCDEFFICSVNSVATILRQVEKSIEDKTYHELYGCHV